MIKWLKRIFKKDKPVKVIPFKPILKPLELTLERIHQFDDCTIGMLSSDGVFKAYTLELPYKDNQFRISSVPVGYYYCTHHNGVKYKDVWILSPTEPRTGILIHSGNTAKDIQGCILVGDRMGKVKGKNAVLNSRVALNSLKKFVGRDAEGKLNSFYLRIK